MTRSRPRRVSLPALPRSTPPPGLDPAPVDPGDRGIRPGMVVAALLVGLGQALVAADVEVPVLRALVSLAVLVGVPVLVLARRGTWGVEPVRVVLYALGVTVAGLLVVGLVMNTVLPVVGVGRPLDRGPVVVVSTLADLALLGWRRPVLLVPDPRGLLRRAVTARLDPTVALGLLAVVAGATGAVRLDNDAGGTVAVAGHVLAGAALAGLLVRRAGPAGRDAVVVLLAGTSLLLSTSLRGWGVVGHDIQREYIVFLLTDHAGRWSMGSLDSAYNACLSLSILPTVVSNHTGLSGVLVLKVLAVLLFATVPVMVLEWSRRLLGRRAALLGALLFVTFPTFFNDMPYLVRQEVAFFFLALVLMAGQEHGWRVGVRRLAVVGFGVAVVLSHYSTTYIMLTAMLVAAVGAQVGPRVAALWRRRRPAGRRTADVTADVTADAAPEPALALAHPLAVLALVAATWLWTVPATHSGGHLAETLVDTVSAITNGTGGPGSSDLSYGIFAGRQATPEERLQLFVDDTLQTRGDTAGRGFLLDQLGAAELAPTVVDPTPLPLTPVGRAIDATPVSASTVNTGLRLLSAGLIQVFLGVGLIVVVCRRRAAARFGREVRWLCVGMAASLVAQVVVPGLSVDYGILRAFQQALLILTPVLAVGLLTSLSWLRRWSGPVAVVGALTMFASLTGVVSRVTGGFPAQLALANSGPYYDLYYTSTSEVSALAWLTGATRGAPVQAESVSDKLAAVRLQTAPDQPVAVSQEFYPTLLRTGTWVFLTGQNVVSDQASVFYTGNLLTYRYPVAALDARLDVVYSGDRSTVYR